MLICCMQDIVDDDWVRCLMFLYHVSCTTQAYQAFCDVHGSRCIICVRSVLRYECTCLCRQGNFKRSFLSSFQKWTSGKIFHFNLVAFVIPGERANSFDRPASLVYDFVNQQSSALIPKFNCFFFKFLFRQRCESSLLKSKSQGNQRYV